ncbi:MAG: tRNA lysidine(34) synthetase TilS [Synechococcus sp.]
MKPIVPSGLRRPWGRWHHRLHRHLCERPALLPSGEPLLLAVSGGQDSLALLALLHDLAPRHHWPLAVLHADHGWHAGSAAVAGHVAAHCAALGLPCRIVRAVELPPGEAAARRWRYGCLEQEARTLGCGRIVTGHTASDRAETLLFHLIRGSGLRGLASLRACRPLAPGLTLVRPLLGLRRGDTLACCRELDLPVRIDPANADRRYSRNRVRSEVLPLLESIRPGAEARLAGLGQVLEDLESSEAALEALALTGLAAGDGLDLDRWCHLPSALARRLLHRWLLDHSGQAISAATLAEVQRQLLASACPRVLPLPGGWQLQREPPKLVLRRTDPDDLQRSGSGLPGPPLSGGPGGCDQPPAPGTG